MAGKRYHSARYFFRTTAFSLVFFSFFIGTCSAVKSNGGERSAAETDEKLVILECPLTADISKTKQSIIIKHFNSTSDYTAEVLGCDWLGSQPKIDCLPSSFGAELIEIMTDRVRVRMPADRVQNGSYRCQFVPPDSAQPFNDCSLRNTEDISTTRAPARVESQEPESQNDSALDGRDEKPSESADDQLVSHLFRGFIVFFLLAILAAMVMFVLRYMRKRRNTTDRCLMQFNSSSHDARQMLNARNEQPMTNCIQSGRDGDYTPETAPLMPSMTQLQCSSATSHGASVDQSNTACLNGRSDTGVPSRPALAYSADTVIPSTPPSLWISLLSMFVPSVALSLESDTDAPSPS